MDRDGTRDGYDLELTRAVVRRRAACRSSPAGAWARSTTWPTAPQGGADAVLAASIFHFGQHTVREAKEYLAARGITVRPS